MPKSYFKEDSIVDTTNVPNNTYYPSSNGLQVSDDDIFKDISLTGKLIDGVGETTSLIIEGTNDEDTVNGDWVQIFGCDKKNNCAANIISVTNGTNIFAIDFDNWNYRFIRFKITTSAATNTVIIKMRRKI